MAEFTTVLVSSIVGLASTLSNEISSGTYAGVASATFMLFSAADAGSSTLNKSSKFKLKLSSKVNSWPLSMGMLLNLLTAGDSDVLSSPWNNASMSALLSRATTVSVLEEGVVKSSKLMALMSSWLKVKPSLAVDGSSCISCVAAARPAAPKATVPKSKLNSGLGAVVALSSASKSPKFTSSTCGKWVATGASTTASTSGKSKAGLLRFRLLFWASSLTSKSKLKSS